MIVPEKFHYKANGKLLLTGEYFVLDGAQALAIPTKKGQHFSVQPFHAEPDVLLWESFDEQGEIWFEGWFSLSDLGWIEGSNEEVGLQLQRLFSVVKQSKNITFKSTSLSVKTRLEFPRNWGLGTSSTLISFMGKWFGVDPFHLLNKGFGGSGYDVACAENIAPIIYQRTDHHPIFTTVKYHPNFHENLFFVHQGKKQSSREAIIRYKKLVQANPDTIQYISQLTQQFLGAEDLTALQSAMLAHEQFISQQLSLSMIQDRFLDFPGQLKSLGAWGGDFILAASTASFETVSNYFKQKKLTTIIPFKDMIF